MLWDGIFLWLKIMFFGSSPLYVSGYWLCHAPRECLLHLTPHQSFRDSLNSKCWARMGFYRAYAMMICHWFGYDFFLLGIHPRAGSELSAQAYWVGSYLVSCRYLYLCKLYILDVLYRRHLTSRFASLVWRFVWQFHPLRWHSPLWGLSTDYIYHRPWSISLSFPWS